MPNNKLTIRICKTPIKNTTSEKFHGLIFDGSLEPNKTKAGLEKSERS